MTVRPVAHALGALLFAISLPGTAFAEAPSLDDLAGRARENPHDADAQTAYGKALLLTGSYRQAERVLRTASRLRGHTAEALFDVARVAFARRDYRAARSACRPLTRDHRDTVLAHVCMARAFLVWNRGAPAFEELEAAIAKDPNHFEALLALGDAHRLRASVAEAEAAYRKAIDADPSRAEPHLGLGRLYLSVRRLADAKAAFRKGLEKEPGMPALEYQLGRLLGGTEEAIALLGQAAELRPKWADPRAALAMAQLKAGRTEAAVATFTEAIALNGRLAQAHAGRGRALMATGAYEEAQKSLERALELVPNLNSAALDLARLYEQTERVEEAIEKYREAADLDRSDPRPLLEGAALALRLGRDVLAAAFLDRTLDMHPKLAAALALYGDVMRARGDRDKARSYYAQALAGEGPRDRAHIDEAMAELDRPERKDDLRPAVVSPNP